MTLLRADARNIPLSDGCVQCVVTSPPYWGLRDYGTPGQIGLEQTPDAYVAELVAVFREVRRVLRDDGVLWLNLGSTYFGGGQGGGGSFASERPGWQRLDAAGASGRIQSRRGQRVPACGSDGTALPDSTGADSAYSCLCDGCLADWMTHRGRTAGSVQPTERSASLPSLTGRDTAPTGCAEASPVASLLDAPVSTTIESWRQHRGACSRCDTRSSSLSAVRSFAADAPAFARMTWGNYTGRLKQKDLVPIPWMVAMALQADGWYLRSDIIWSKPNPMPESVTDRPTKAHEYVFLLTKRERYAYDAKAISEPASQPYGLPASVAQHKQHALGRTVGTLGTNQGAANRNTRTVWTIATQPYSGAHFATMPEALVRRCVLAGSTPGSLVFDPFGGSGTTAAVALSMGRRAVCTELNPAYLALADKRTHVTLGLPLEMPA